MRDNLYLATLPISNARGHAEVELNQSNLVAHLGAPAEFLLWGGK
jgi:hypothetical protein